MDLSKAFDRLNQNLFLCKLKAYAFNRNGLTFIQSYLSNRHQKTKLGNTFSKWQKVSTGMLQHSILNALVYNTFITDLFLFIKLLHFATMQVTILYSLDENANIVINMTLQ